MLPRSLKNPFKPRPVKTICGRCGKAKAYSSWYKTCRLGKCVVPRNRWAVKAAKENRERVP